MPTLGVAFLLAHRRDHHNQVHKILWLCHDILDLDKKERTVLAMPPEKTMIHPQLTAKYPHQKKREQETSNSLGVRMRLISFYHGYYNNFHHHEAKNGVYVSGKAVGAPS